MKNNLEVAGFGYCLEGQTVLNDAFATFLDTNDDWIVQRTGIRQRIISEKSAAELGSIALRNALEKANLQGDDLDLIVVATYATEDIMPNTASTIKRLLEIESSAPAFDINVACSGFVYALEVARTFGLAQGCKHIAVIGTERQSQYLNFEDRTTSILFGDGAGALVLSASEDKKVHDAYLVNKIDKNQSLNLKVQERKTPFSNDPVDETPCYLEMKGQDVFQFAVRTVKTALKEVLAKNDMSLSDIDYIVLHQANRRIIQFVASSLKIEESKFVVNVDEVANTSSASIPIALSQHIDKVGKGYKYVLIGFGAGLSTGASIIEY
ncbi:MAG: 3-oxoacyl-ACP synthase III family protein [Culicoidibacterales bacterium]